MYMQSFAYWGNGNRFATTEKMPSASGPRASWPLGLISQGNKVALHSIFTLKPNLMNYFGKKITSKYIVFLLRLLSFKWLPHTQHTIPVYKSQSHHTQKLRKSSIKQRYVKYLIITSFWFEFFVWEIDPWLARTQPNSCIAFLLPQTLQNLAKTLFVLANTQDFIIMYY